MIILISSRLSTPHRPNTKLRTILRKFIPNNPFTQWEKSILDKKLMTPLQVRPSIMCSRGKMPTFRSPNTSQSVFPHPSQGDFKTLVIFCLFKKPNLQDQALTKNTISTETNPESELEFLVLAHLWAPDSPTQREKHTSMKRPIEGDHYRALATTKLHQSLASTMGTFTGLLSSREEAQRT